MLKKVLSALSKIPAAIGKKATLVISGILVLSLFLLCVRVFWYKPTPTVDVDLLYTTLTGSSELTTAKLHLNGFAEYEDDGLPIISKASFLMTFSATADIGIKMEDVVIEADDINKIIWLTIPKAAVQDVDVERESIKFYSEKLALFNVNEKEDMLAAEQAAEQKAREQAETMGVIEFADQQAAAIIEGLLSQAIPSDYTFQYRA